MESLNESDLKVNVEEIKKHLEENDEFAKHAGMKIEEVRLGYAKTSVVLDKIHMNSAGMAQGGLMFTLADFALAAASAACGRVSLTASANITYIAPGRGKKLTAVAKALNVGRRLSNYEIKVTNEDGLLIASGQAAMYSKDTPILK